MKKFNEFIIEYKMSLQEKVNAQSKHIQLIQRINYDQENLKKSITLHMGADLGIHYIDEKLATNIDGVYVGNNPTPKRNLQERTMMAMYGDDCLE